LRKIEENFLGEDWFVGWNVGRLDFVNIELVEA
jgi:hypothetical protein